MCFVWSLNTIKKSGSFFYIHFEFTQMILHYLCLRYNVKCLYLNSNDTFSLSYTCQNSICFYYRKQMLLISICLTLSKSPDTSALRYPTGSSNAVRESIAFRLYFLVFVTGEHNAHLPAGILSDFKNRCGHIQSLLHPRIILAGENFGKFLKFMHHTMPIFI